MPNSNPLQPESREVFLDPLMWHQLDKLGGLKRDRLPSGFTIEIENHEPAFYAKIYQPDLILPINSVNNTIRGCASLDAAKEYAYEQYCEYLRKYVPKDIGPASVDFD